MSGRKRILITEDDSISRYLFNAFLSDTYDLHIVASVSEAKALLSKIEYDLVITDIHFEKGESGVELLSHIRSIPELKDLKVFAHSAYNAGENYRSIIDADFNSFIPKPTMKDQMLRIISSEFAAGPGPIY
jgi:CheY-like chemotaxis protein